MGTSGSTLQTAARNAAASVSGVVDGDERAGNGVELLDHHLVADSRPGREEVHALLAGELLDPTILVEVLRRRVLDVVIEDEHRLARIVDPRSADRPELLHHGRRVVVGHHVARPDRHEVAGAQCAPRGALGEVSAGDLLDDGLAHGCLSDPTRSARRRR